MRKQTNSQESRLLRWPYWACGVPLLGLLLIGLYLWLFSIYRAWGIGSAATPVTDVNNYYFKILTALLRNLGDPRSGELYNAITAKHVIVWGYGTGLVGLTLVAAIAICAYVIFKGMRGSTTLRKWIVTLSVLLVCLVFYPYVIRELGAFNKFTVIPRQFWGLIRAQLSPQQGLLDIVNFEMFIVAIGYAVSTLLALASAATLWPVGEVNSTPTVEEDAKYLSMQMKHLRLILYVGALLLVVITFRHRMTFNWALDYLQPLPLLKNQPDYDFAGLMYEHLKTLTANTVLATSVLNTLLLAALYVPAGLLLQHRAHALSRLAVEVGSEPKKTDEKDSVAGQDGATVASKREEWLKSRNLIFPFKEQVPKVIAILSPLLAGPLGELLNFFK